MRVGFAGLGAIGAPMAARCATVHDLAVWNRTHARATAFAAEHHGVTVAATPRELAQGRDAVITCLPTSADLELLLEGHDGLLAGLAPGAILVDCTSGDPATSRRIAERLAVRNISFVDAPVSGGPPLASQGKLTVMCGGSAADVERARAVVAPFAGKVVRMGDVGTGHAMKAVNNALLAINIVAIAEGLVTLARTGIAPRAAMDVLNASSGRSFVSEALVPERVLTGTWPKLFRLALLEKDIGIAHDVALDAGVDDPLLAQAREMYRDLRASLGESADYLDPIRVAEVAAGVELRG
ncbi:MAG TPA: NAD(P)-dependent oxidoreductase [Gemmatimonadales bacterium]|jgi:3-hydroxyisobutyrate dehydrogenase|nr:NAD(P)-dependent oxidoreductase [Gemmatimonadales bacterium]